MAIDTQTIIDNKDIVPTLTTLVQSEFAKLYTYAVKNLRMVVLGMFGFLVLASSAFFALCLLIFSIMASSGASLGSVATVGIILGALLILGVAGFLFFALSQKFWIKTFKIDDMVAKAQSRSETYTTGATQIPSHA